MADLKDVSSDLSTGGAYTEPFGLSRHLKRPALKLDAVPVLDLLVIALIFGLLFTRFVMVPGMQVDLPDSEMQMQPSTRTVSVLTIGNRGMLLFDGALFEVDTIGMAFENYIQEKADDEIVLLVKAEGSMDLQRFLRLCAMAQQAGFVQVQIVGEHSPLIRSNLPTSADQRGPQGGVFF
ncbi:MAG: biopolymer transporter ExbD [Puniceicoccaceae bacterium]|nr:MAG: biopolymer transporter ExbD [Puniceicoccaceae bacterium]